LSSIVNHLMKRGVKVVGVSISVAATGMQVWIDQVTPYLKIPANYKYGVDYVWCGFVSGEEGAMAALRTDFWAATGTDYYRTPLDKLPLMSLVHKGTDFVALVYGSGDATGTQKWMRQWPATININMISCSVAGGIPSLMPYVGMPGGLYGIMKSTRSAAEYDIMSGILGPATSTMDAYSMAVVFIIIFITMGTTGFIRQKLIEKRRKT